MLALLGLLLIVGSGAYVVRRCWCQDPRCTEDIVMAVIAGCTTLVCVLVLVLA
jgi:flagellar biogenesis protein FliO